MGGGSGLQWEMPRALGDQLGEQRARGGRGRTVGRGVCGDFGSRGEGPFAGIEGWIPLDLCFTERRWAAGLGISRWGDEGGSGEWKMVAWLWVATVADGLGETACVCLWMEEMGELLGTFA